MAETKKATALNELQKLAARCQGQISKLASFIVGAVEEDFLSTSIPTNAWAENTDPEPMAEGLAYAANVPVEGAEAKDGVDAVLPYGSLAAAAACGMSNTATVVNGAVRFYAVTVPTVAIEVQVQIIKGKDQGGNAE